MQINTPLPGGVWGRTRELPLVPGEVGSSYCSLFQGIAFPFVATRLGWLLLRGGGVKALLIGPAYLLLESLLSLFSLSPGVAIQSRHTRAAETF